MKKTKALINKLLTELENTPLLQIACEKVGISRNTFYRWMKEDPAFLAQANYALSLGKGRVNDIAVSNVLAGIKAKDVRYTMYWLDRNHYDFRRPHIHRIDSEDPFAQFRYLAEISKKLEIEDKALGEMSASKREDMEQARKDAEVFFKRWGVIKDDIPEPKKRKKKPPETT